MEVVPLSRIALVESWRRCCFRHSEEILRDFSEPGCLDTKMRNQRVETMGGRYRYGRVADLDGGLGYGIEYDVLQGND